MLLTTLRSTNGVNLSPPNWATHVKITVENWGKRNKGPSALEIRSEIKRLRKLLISHEALNEAVKDDKFFAHIAIDQTTTADTTL